MRSNESSRNVPVVAVVSTMLQQTQHYKQNAAGENASFKYQEVGISELLTKPLTITKLSYVLRKYLKQSTVGLGNSTGDDTLPPLSFSLQPNMLLNEEILAVLQELEILEKTVHTFQEQAKEILKKTQELDFTTSESNKTSICKNLHALKGISLNSGANLVGKLCDELERIVLVCSQDIYEQKLITIEECLHQTIKKLEKLLLP